MMSRLTLMLWLQAVVLALAFATGGISGAQEQFTGAVRDDLPLMAGSVAATAQAAASGDQDKARLAMETLYHNWRLFRQRNIDAHPEDKAYPGDFEAIEQRLYAASQAVDMENLPDAGVELDAARLLLLTLQQRYPPAAR